MENHTILTITSEREKNMTKSFYRRGSLFFAGLAMIWLFAACGSAATKNGGESGGGGNNEVEATSSNETSHAQTSGTDTTGELNITTSTNTSTNTATTTTTATSTTTTTAGQTAVYTVAFTVSAAPATITSATTPTFTWIPASPAYKVYVTLAGSTTIKWGLKCATGTNCINSPVNLGDQSVTGATATPVGATPAATTLAAGTYNVVVETASTTGTISQAGWVAFTVQ